MSVTCTYCGVDQAAALKKLVSAVHSDLGIKGRELKHEGFSALNKRSKGTTKQVTLVVHEDVSDSWCWSGECVELGKVLVGDPHQPHSPGAEEEKIIDILFLSRYGFSTKSRSLSTL